MKHTPVSLRLYLFLLFVSLLPQAIAQPAERYIKVLVAPERANWEYKVGEPARFTVQVTQANVGLANAEVRYAVMPEKMKPVKSGTLKLKEGKATIDGGTMNTPGFLRCEVYAQVEGKEYKGLATAAYDANAIQPATNLPDDFTAFWDKAKADAAKIPLDARMVLMPERCTEKVNVYHVNFNTMREGARYYGILCVPKTAGKYPAILHVPGAGVRPYSGDVARAEKGAITLQVGIHGVPVTMPAEVYDNLGKGPLAGYWAQNLDDRDNYYYKRVYLGCVRAVDFINSLPEYDGSNLAVMGGSQGGALSIITAALDSRIKWLVAYYPALSDLTGYLKGRAGGWPHMFSEANAAFNNKPDKVKTSKYYDVVNFARHVKVPGFYSWGYNDETCPPTSMHAAYNVISAPKSLFIAQETGHWTYPEQGEKADTWLFAQFKAVAQK
ncbi:acetylxylan esterase [Nibrella saemangeumensis]|uniref:Acetylxylan esterase n=1 Tax=Nibrella saemangeumensis TaxID=1084526 RepID=A0ABP8MAV4_9BACT